MVPGMEHENQPADIWRRQDAYLAPGRSIVMSFVPVEHVALWGDFMDDAGIPPEGAVSSIMCPVPIPRYPLARPRPGAKAETLWHPFLWLPPHVATRRNEAEAADDDLYALRVALEAETFSLWDQGAGAWVDVLSTAGVDIDQPDGLARARAWLGGEEGPELDDIDMTGQYWHEEAPWWASEVAVKVLPTALRIVWSESAGAQIDTLIGILDDPELSGTDEEARSNVCAVAGISTAWFRRVPAIGSSRLPGRPSDAFRALEERLSKPSVPANELRYEIVPALIDVLSVVRDIFSPWVEAFVSFVQEMEEVQTSAVTELIAFAEAQELGEEEAGALAAGAYETA
jgi:hypothetical protein